MAASGSGGEAARLWTATSTWAPSGDAAVEDAVSFETSDLDAEESPAGVVLTRPATDEGGDAPPCEVTVSFRGMYEIHRVYVRSTARIYEIYQSTSAKGISKDYLCTVRCGPATKESQLSGEECNASMSEKRGHEMKSISISSSDDSWVDVKIPESPNNTSESQERNVAETCQENNLVHYEATAEMSDVSPCVSLTIRLLSLQSKTSVHIEEIYILADPVEPTNDDSVTGPGNMGGSSLLAMLVPGLMQVSKSRNYNIDDGYFSHGSRSQPTQDHAVKEGSLYEKTAQETRPCVLDGSSAIGRGIDSTDGGPVSNEKSNQAQLPFKDPMSVELPVQTKEYTRMPSVDDQPVSKTDELVNPPMNGIFTPYGHIDRKLDMLLSKVEKVELYCSRFEDRMIKPLGSIEARLQRLEQQFDSFSGEIKSLHDSSARMSAPDGPYDAKSKGKAHNDATARTAASITDREPGLRVRAPDFSSEDSCNYHVTSENQVHFQGSNMVPKLIVKAPEFIFEPEITGEKLHEEHISPVNCVQSSKEKEHKTSPGLVVKVPEFPDDDDDDDEVEEEKKSDVCDHTQDDTLCTDSIDISKGKNRVSVNGALASALEALLMSTKGTSSSKSDVFPASSLSAGNTYESLSCSLSPGNVDEMPTKDGSIDQIPGSNGGANLDGTSTSCQETDGAPHTSLSKPVLDSMVDVNEKKNHVDSDKEAFGASTVLLGVLPQHHISEEFIDNGSCINEQNNGATEDGLGDQIPGSIGSANLDGTFISCQEIDGATHTSLSMPVLDSMVDINEKKNHVDSDTEAIGATTVSLGILPQHHISEESIDDESCINEQNNGATEDGLDDQIPGSIGSANLDGTLISCHEIDGAPHNSLSMPMFDIKVDINEKNNNLDSDKEAIGATTVSLGILPQHHISEESIDDGSCINEQNSGPKLDTLPFITNSGPLDPHQAPAACESVDNGTQMNENRPVVSLLEFLAARNSRSCKNGTSEMCCSTNGLELPSFERTLAEVGKSSKNISHLLVKKALEDDSEDKCTSSATAAQKILTENSSFLWSLDDSFSKLDVEDSWSDLINMEAFSAACANQPVVSASTGRIAEGKCVEDPDLTGVGMNSTVTPIAGDDLQKFCDLLYDYKDGMTGMTSTENRTSKSSPSLEVLLAESSESEAQISDTEDTDNGAGIGSAPMFDSFSSDDSAAATTGPLIDVVDMPREAESEPKPLETFGSGSSGDPISLI